MTLLAKGEKNRSYNPKLPDFLQEGGQSVGCSAREPGGAQSHTSASINNPAPLWVDQIPSDSS